MLYDIEKLFSELDDENQDLSFKSQQISDRWTAAVDAAKESDDVGPIISWDEDGNYMESEPELVMPPGLEPAQSPEPE
jgi:hypothetical protein